MENKPVTDYLDIELLDDYFKRLGKSIVDQMLTLYCQQVEIYLSDIENAQLNDSETDWQQHCHKMKGATASIGMHKLHGKLKLLEKVEANQEEKAMLLSELKKLNTLSIQAFNAWLESL